MDDAGFDRLAIGLAEGRWSRRRVLRMIGVAALLSVIGPLRRLPAFAEDSCAEGERRVPIRDAAHLEQCEKKVQKEGFVPPFNGCGAAEGYGDYYVPDGIPLVYDFYDACKAHDICYSTCGSAQKTCDDNFLNDMNALCNAQHTGFWSTPGRRRCASAATIYHFAVASVGEDAHEAAQIEACDCCEPACVLCNCNDKIYTSVQRCLDECKVSLGCFTGICAPTECP